MSFLEKAWNWNATAEEWRADYPCDRYAAWPHRVIMRAIDIDAPASLTYRWVCQLKVAPYSYDMLDTPGRRSPQSLTPGLEHLATGQRFLAGLTIAEFEVDRHVTVTGRPGRICGSIALTYAVIPLAPMRSRLIAKFHLESRTRWDHVRAVLLAWGDLIMMRKQFLTLKKLAERDATAGGAHPGALRPPAADSHRRLHDSD
jgi:hypothetical protein